MRVFYFMVALLWLMNGADAEAGRKPLAVPTRDGPLLIEGFEGCANSTCPAVLILSGSKGFGAFAYDQIGRVFRDAGLDGYLVHVLSTADLKAINAAPDARTRKAYYARRMPSWTSAVQSAVSFLAAQSQHAKKVGMLGISLGAEIAAAAVGKSDAEALVLVDGGFPEGDVPTGRLPPLLLIWGQSDEVFPLATAKALQQGVKSLGIPATLRVYRGGGHDFFLRSGTPDAESAWRSAADFFATSLSR